MIYYTLLFMSMSNVKSQEQHNSGVTAPPTGANAVCRDKPPSARVDDAVHPHFVTSSQHGGSSKLREGQLHDSSYCMFIVHKSYSSLSHTLPTTLIPSFQQFEIAAAKLHVLISSRNGQEARSRGIWR